MKKMYSWEIICFSNGISLLWYSHKKGTNEGENNANRIIILPAGSTGPGGLHGSCTGAAQKAAVRTDAVAGKPS